MTTIQPADADFVEALIERAAFDDEDRDLGTSGLCAQFALCLYDTVAPNPSCRLALVCDNAVHKRQYPWRHAALAVGERLFDITGAIEARHAIENYCWGPGPGPGAVFKLPRATFLAATTAVKNAYDPKHRGRRWRQKLRQARMQLRPAFPRLYLTQS
jgi:hypothetical protein